MSLRRLQTDVSLWPCLRAIAFAALLGALAATILWCLIVGMTSLMSILVSVGGA